MRRSEYRLHLDRKHSIKLSPLSPRFNADTSIDPNINDPNNYCRSCSSRFVSPGEYRRHLRVSHHMRDLPPIGSENSNPKIEPDLYDPNFYC